MVDHLTGAAGMGRNAHKVHTAFSGEEACPEQVVFAGQQADFIRPLPGFFFDQVQGEVEVFPGGGGLFLQPDALGGVHPA